MVICAGLTSWPFITIEQVGDANEEPFEGTRADAPLNALGRSIEIDLLQVLGETEIPEPENLTGIALY